METYAGAALRWELPGGQKYLVDIPVRGQDGVVRSPSVVFVPSDGRGRFLTGEDALSAKASGFGGNLYSLFKRHLKCNEPYPHGTDAVTPIALTARMIGTVLENVSGYLNQKQFAGIPVTYAFTHPASWENPFNFRQAIQLALQSANLQIEKPYLIDEPIAAALGAAHTAEDAHLLEESDHIFVCDLGGGTLDFAVVIKDEHGVVTQKSPVFGAGGIGMSNIDKLLGLLLHEHAGMPVTSSVRKVFAKLHCRRRGA